MYYTSKSLDFFYSFMEENYKLTDEFILKNYTLKDGNFGNYKIHFYGTDLWYEV